jgi:hypothetical protein
MTFKRNATNTYHSLNLIWILRKESSGYGNTINVKGNFDTHWTKNMNISMNEPI